MSRKKSDEQSQSGDTEQRMLFVTYPDGREEVVPDDGRRFPKGTMIAWDEVTKSGKREMRWTVVGGGWPFDD